MTKIDITYMKYERTKYLYIYMAILEEKNWKSWEVCIKQRYTGERTPTDAYLSKNEIIFDADNDFVYSAPRHYLNQLPGKKCSGIWIKVSDILFQYKCLRKCRLQYLVHFV